MRVKVLGFTEFAQSKKSGNVGAWLFFSYSDQGVTGVKCASSYVNVKVGFPKDLKPGDEVVLAFDMNGFLTGIERVK